MNILTKFSTRQKKLILYFLDSSIIIFALILSSFIMSYPKYTIFNELFFIFVISITIIKLTIFSIFGIYDFMWRYASKEEFIKVTISCIITTPIIFISNKLIQLFFNHSFILLRTIFIDLVLTILLIVGLRAILKSIYQFILERSVQNNNSAKKRVLIVGAGEAGNIIANEISRNPNSHWSIVGYIDDKKELIGRKIHQKPVLGTTDDLTYHIIKKQIEEIIIAMPTASSKTIRKIIDIANQNNIRCKTTPKLSDLIEGNLNINQIREVNIADLLGRNPIEIDTQSISQYVSNKVILITGAGGSIGSEICRQLIQYGPSKMIILDHSENNTYLIEQELQNIGNYATKLIPVVQDIKTKFLLENTFSKHKPEIIFHAAAHKHVPLMEDNLHEVIENNIHGTKNVIELADKYKIEKFVLISTDKAVNPTNVMGASKRVCELLVQAYSKKSKTIFSSVRFGNVLGSNGSVIPLFKNQIKKGGPVTITHPDITRYFMTIPEAVSLVIQTGEQSKGGEIFILDMGKPIKITELAKDLISLSGFKESEIPIKFTGLRPGEKLYEELFYNKNYAKKTDFNKILIGDKIETNKNIELILEEINTLLKHNTELKSKKTKEQLFNIVTLNTPSKTEFKKS